MDLAGCCEMTPGSPFGPGIEALIIHLHITQAISFERLSRLMAEVFGLSISEGAIANILARAQTPLVAAAEDIATAVRASAVVGSDETSARVRGKMWWQCRHIGCGSSGPPRRASPASSRIPAARLYPGARLHWDQRGCHHETRASELGELPVESVTAGTRLVAEAQSPPALGQPLSHLTDVIRPVREYRRAEPRRHVFLLPRQRKPSPYAHPAQRR